ncbi:MAG: Hsp20/alpha crystallin family protein [Gammaproteobacteria bacterium]|nr:Hsp20/alpha crystallin family protein [Gammaproteobacteria bacterium]
MFSLTRVPHRRLNLLGDFDGLFGGLAPAVAESDNRFLPALDIVETGDGYEVRADLPGIKKENLSVNVEDNTLVIEAESRDESVEKDGNKVIKRERCIGKYRRALQINDAVDESAIRAHYHDGVLTVTLPRAAKAESKKIAVDIH